MNCKQLLLKTSDSVLSEVKDLGVLIGSKLYFVSHYDFLKVNELWAVLKS